MGMEKSVWGGRRAHRGGKNRSLQRKEEVRVLREEAPGGNVGHQMLRKLQREMWVGSRPLEFALTKPPMTVEEYGQGKAWRHCGLQKGLESWESCQKMGTTREGAGPLCSAHQSSSGYGRVDCENSPDVRTIESIGSGGTRR